MFNHQVVEKKWQEKWQKANLYVPDIKRAKRPFYNLWMFPYPSAEGLHAGHAFASTGSDVFGRYQRMKGSDVFQPIGYDSFGIHSENYALKIGEHPSQMLARTTKHYEEQLKSLGHGYDWTRTVTTSDISYYKWTQWLFKELFQAGLAYRKKAEVNFCPSCRTVLADEQVMTPAQAGKEPRDVWGKVVENREDLRVCERCGTITERKQLEQWFFRITDYGDRLLDGLSQIDWSERVKVAQKQWIGRSEGMMIKFQIPNSKFQIKVFTTRPDTLNAVTFLATSKLYEGGKPHSAKAARGEEKIGKFTGKYAVDPLSGRTLPIWDTNYVSPDYGTGVIMGVPAHDERDMEFVKKYHLDIINKNPDQKLWEVIEKKGWGKRKTNYHLRDWLISRQRYWGCPIPMIFCQMCARQGQGWIVSNSNKLLHKDQSDWDCLGWWPEENLPVELPYIRDWKPEGAGKGPLANHKEFYETKCPSCGGKAQRETDVADTFLDSSWYFLRYPSTRSPRSGQVPFAEAITKKWLPVSLYFGGAEHSVLHLMYARFVTMALSDLGRISFEEPFPKFFAHGLMIKGGAKMSKSRGNVVNPDEYIQKFGADTLRLYLMFMGPMDGSPDFRDTGIEGMRKFVNRVWKVFLALDKEAKERPDLLIKMYQTIKKATNDISTFNYNTAISAIMEFVNAIKEAKNYSPLYLKTLAKLIAPFAPHLAEEVWVEVLGMPSSVHQAAWPAYNEKFIASGEVVVVIQVNGKVRGQIKVKNQMSKVKTDVIRLAKKEEKIAKWFDGRKVKRVVFVSGKLVNFVV